MKKQIDKSSLLYVFHIVYKNLFVFLGIQVAIAIISFAASFLVTPKYLSRSVFLPLSFNQYDPFFFVETKSQFVSGDQKINDFSFLLSASKSEQLKHRVIDKLELWKTYSISKEDFSNRWFITKDLLTKDTKINAVFDDQLIELKVYHPKDSMAQIVANAYLTCLEEMLLEQLKSKNEIIIEGIKKSLDSKKSEIDSLYSLLERKSKLNSPLVRALENKINEENKLLAIINDKYTSFKNMNESKYKFFLNTEKPTFSLDAAIPNRKIIVLISVAISVILSILYFFVKED